MFPSSKQLSDTEFGGNKPHKVSREHRAPTVQGAHPRPSLPPLILLTTRACRQRYLGSYGRRNSLFLLLKDERHSLWNLPGGRKSNLHLEGTERQLERLSNLLKSTSLAEDVELPYGLSLAGAPSQPQKNAEASERKMPCLSSITMSGLQADLSPHSASRLSPTRGGAAR